MRLAMRLFRTTWVLLVGVVIALQPLARADTILTGPITLGTDFSVASSGRVMRGLSPTAAPFKAKCDGTTDDSAAFVAWWTQLLITGNVGTLPAATCKINSQLYWNITNAAAVGVTVVGAGKQLSILDLTAVSSGPALLIGASAGNYFYPTFRDFGVKCNIAATCIQFGHEDYSDPINAALVDIWAGNRSTSANAVCAEFNYYLNSSFTSLICNNGAAYTAGTALELRQAVFNSFFGSYSTAKIGIDFLAGYNYGNTFNSIDVENVTTPIQSDVSTASKNTFIGGTIVWKTSAAGCSNGCGVVINAGSNNFRFIGTNFSRADSGSIYPIASGAQAAVVQIDTDIEGTFNFASLNVAPRNADADLTALIPAGFNGGLTLRYQDNVTNPARWRVVTAGSPAAALNITRYNSSGSSIDNPLSVDWATGLVTLQDGLTVASGNTLLGSGLYPVYQTATTTTANTTNGQANITVASASNISIGDSIWATFVPEGSYVTNISGTTITMSQNATATGTVTAVTFGQNRFTVNSTTLTNTLGAEYGYFGVASKNRTTWPNQYWDNDPPASQSLYSISPNGQFAAIFASRSSDNVGASSSHTIPFGILSVNDSTAVGGHGTWGAYIEGHVLSSATLTAHINEESSLVNGWTTVAIDPYGMNPAGLVTNLRLDIGIGSGVTNNASDALEVVNNGGQYKSGITIGATALDTSGGSAAAVAMGQNQGLFWYSGAGNAAWKLYSTATSGSNAVVLGQATGLDEVGPGQTIQSNASYFGLALTPSSGNASQTYIELDGIGTTKYPFLELARARGVVSGLSAVQNTDKLFEIDGTVYDGASFSLPVGVYGKAEENFDNLHHAASLHFQTVNTISESTAVDRLTITRSGGVQIGNGVDPGVGSVSVSGTVVLHGTTVSSLPTGIIGATAYVTDAVTCTFLATVTGGGSAFCPVIYNGTSWVGS